MSSSRMWVGGVLAMGSALVACRDGGGEDEVGASSAETAETESSESTDTEEGESSSGDSESVGDSESSTSTDSDTEDSEDTDSGETGVEPDPRQTLLETYAPRIWLTNSESYFPAEVEWTYPHLARFPDGEGQYWVRTQAELDAPSDTLPFFAGELETAPVYAYWAEKDGDIVDLVYFVWFPYNRGKSVADTIWGNHVGDWEHITVRLNGSFEDGFEPTQVYLSAHSFGGAYEWGNGEVDLFEATHPVVYTATGSHGFWAQAGAHVYQSIGIVDPFFDVCVSLICADLTDIAEAGVAWDTWEVVYGMDFFAQEGLEGVDWPVWMSDDFGNPGGGDPTVPGMGPIYRWGNPEDCSVLGIPIDITDLIGVCRLENGPTGPVSKSTWGAELK